VVAVEITPDAARQIDALPAAILPRVLELIERLRHWPDVSGYKRLVGELRGAYRLRTGDYRLLFTVENTGTRAEPEFRITVFRIDNRRDVYEK